MHYIYKLTNQISNKSYIGYTSRTPEQRFKSHCLSAKNGSNLHLHCAIRKYGEDTWDIEILEESPNGEYLLKERENYYISQYDNLYNMARGGQGGDLSQFIDYSKCTGRKPGFKVIGRKVSPEGRKKISEAAKRRTTKASDFFTDESRKKMSEANLGIPKSEAAKKKMSEAAKNREKFLCPHCNSMYWKTHYVRWHGDKCKMNGK